MEQLRARLVRLRTWWCVDLWSPEALGEATPRQRRLAVLVARCAFIVTTGFRTERIKLRAAHLTYVTMLSIVPAIVVVFSLFTAFGGFGHMQETLKGFLVSSLAVTQKETIEHYVDRFVAQSGKVGGFGTIVLLFTAVSLVGNIERAFNDIWGVRRDRTLLQRFQVYWPLVTLGPILVGLSLSLTAAAAASDVVRGISVLRPLVNFALKVLPIVFTWGFLTLLYEFLPNTRVKLQAAIVGGVVAGTFWEIAKRLYAGYAEITLESPSVYGSLAAVPLFILWLYVSWMLALLGASLTFAVQNAHSYEPEELDARNKSQKERELLAARLIVAVSDSFHRGAGPVQGQTLFDQLCVPPRFAQRVLADLVETELLVETAARAGEDAAFMPARPLAMISMAQVVQAMREVGSQQAKGGASIREDDVLGRRVSEALGEGEAAVDGALGRVTLADLVAGAS